MEDRNFLVGDLVWNYFPYVIIAVLPDGAYDCIDGSFDTDHPEWNPLDVTSMCFTKSELSLAPEAGAYNADLLLSVCRSIDDAINKGLTYNGEPIGKILGVTK